MQVQLERAASLREFYVALFVYGIHIMDTRTDREKKEWKKSEKKPVQSEGDREWEDKRRQLVAKARTTDGYMNGWVFKSQIFFAHIANQILLELWHLSRSLSLTLYLLCFAMPWHCSSEQNKQRDLFGRDNCTTIYIQHHMHYGIPPLSLPPPSPPSPPQPPLPKRLRPSHNHCLKTFLITKTRGI